MSQNFLKRRLVVVEVERRSHSSVRNGPGLQRVLYLIAVRIYQIEKMHCFFVLKGSDCL